MLTWDSRAMSLDGLLRDTLVTADLRGTASQFLSSLLSPKLSPWQALRMWMMRTNYFSMGAWRAVSVIFRVRFLPFTVSNRALSP
jgi:hypothetical protein